MQQNTLGFELSAQQKYVFERRCDTSIPEASISMQLTGRIDPERLKKAVSGIVARHEMWRTSYRRQPGMRFPVQIIAEDAPFEWNELDLLSQTSDDQTKSVANAFESITIDAEHSPILRLALLRTSKESSILIAKVPALSADRRTFQNFVREMVESYEGVSQDEQSGTLQYADYAQWQADLLSSTAPQDLAVLEYWAKPDWGSTTQPTLPFSRRVEGGTNKHSGASLTCPIDFSIVECMQSFNVDPAAAALAAWQVLLWRLTGASLFTLAISSDDRRPEDLANAFGLFSRAVPFIADLTPNLSFREFAQKTQQDYQQGLQFQNYYCPPKSGPNLPSIGFTAERALTSRDAGGVIVSSIESQYFSETLDLNLRCIVGPENASLDLIYNRAALWNDGAARIVRSFSALLKAALTSPDTPIHALPTVQKSAEAPIRTSYSNGCVHRLFEERAAASPSKFAVRSGDAALTFEELSKRANRLAHFLQERGVGPDVPVGLCLDRSVNLIVGLLAILKAGGCYVPLATDQPAKRLLFQLSEAKASLVVTQKEFAALFQDSPFAAVCVDDQTAFAEQSADNPDSTTSSDNLAYIIYTSGSTGQPKGVAIRHSSLINYSEFICGQIGIKASGEALTFASVSTIAADLGNTCIFPALISGGCLDVVPYEITTSARGFAEYLAAHPIDVLKIAPYHLAALMSERINPATLLPKRYLFLGGEALHWDLFNRIQSAAPCKVFNHYGPTESTVGCCTFDVAAEDVSEWGTVTVPIGHPIANTQIYILDEMLQTVPVGIAGELYVGGAGLAREYVNRPDLTEECFVATPISAGIGERLYKTGDLGRRLPNGAIEFLGRADRQVKIRGFRVEPAEIGAALEQHASITHAVVAPFEENGETCLAAYFVSKNPVPASELRGFLSQILPAYMVPAELVAVNKISLSPNGKIDLEALSIAREKNKNATKETPPRTPEEAKLAAIWSEVLKRPCSDVHANFFALGGHSLLATQIVSRIRDSFRVQLPLHSFLQTPTIADLIPKIEELPRLQEDRLEHILAQIENLSDEEAAQLLAEMESERT